MSRGIIQTGEIAHVNMLLRAFTLIVYTAPLIGVLVASLFLPSPLPTPILTGISIWAFLGIAVVGKILSRIDKSEKETRQERRDQELAFNIEQERIRRLRNDYDARMEIRRRVDAFRQDVHRRWQKEEQKKKPKPIEFITEQDMEL